MSDPRFFIDHGMLHDRVTGKHVTTNVDSPYEDGITACCALLNKLADESADSLALLARGVELFDGPTVDQVVTAICVMIRRAAEAHRDPSDPYSTSGTYAAATFAEELADDIASGEWRKHLRSTQDKEK